MRSRRLRLAGCRAVLVGATRGMGRALARELAVRGARLVLLGRDGEDLRRSAADLRLRGAVAVETGELDLARPEGFDAAFDAAWAVLGGVDLFVLTAARFAGQEELENDDAALTELLEINVLGTIGLLERVRRRMLEGGGGTLCAFSSVAGERARRPGVLYGASKALLTRYLEGLDHRYRGRGLITVCVLPGFVRTSMTAGLPAPPFAGDPGPVARRVVRALERGRPRVYAPAIWRLVMAAVRRLPRAVLRRVDF